jgi:TRAF3-interacting protein 1
MLPRRGLQPKAPSQRLERVAPRKTRESGKLDAKKGKTADEKAKSLWKRARKANPGKEQSENRDSKTEEEKKRGEEKRRQEEKRGGKQRRKTAEENSGGKQRRKTAEENSEAKSDGRRLAKWGKAALPPQKGLCDTGSVIR